MTKPEELLPVEQVDRDAAAQYVSGDHGWSVDSPSSRAIREGKASLDLSQAFARHRIAVTRAQPTQEPVAYRYVHHDYMGRKVSRYGDHPERVNGHDPIETHPLYAAPATPAPQPDLAKLVEAFAVSLDGGDFDSVSGALNSRMCCDGHMCGCQGSTVGQYLAYELRAALAAFQKESNQ